MPCLVEFRGGSVPCHEAWPVWISAASLGNRPASRRAAHEAGRALRSNWGEALSSVACPKFFVESLAPTQPGSDSYYLWKLPAGGRMSGQEAGNTSQDEGAFL
jgi:hypothetical protein